MDVVSIILEPITDYLVEPIGRQFGYLFHYKSNISNLETEDEKLRNIKHEVEQRVDAVLRNSHRIARHIQEWLKEVGTINSEVASIFGT